MVPNESETFRDALPEEVTLKYYEEIGSTNDAAFEAAEAGGAEMTVFLAERQTMGRGRMARRWESVPGACLTFSVLLRAFPDEAERLNFFAPLAGLAVTDALAVFGIDAEVKWPNDVLIARHKVCGVLCETRWLGESLLGPVLGIGINLRRGSAPQTTELVYPASSVEDESGIRLPRPDFLGEIIRQIAVLRPLLGTPAFLSRWESKLAYRGEIVRLVAPDRPPVTARVLGIDCAGNLLAESAAGTLRLTAGEVSLRPER